MTVSLRLPVLTIVKRNLKPYILHKIEPMYFYGKWLQGLDLTYSLKYFFMELVWRIATVFRNVWRSR